MLPNDKDLYKSIQKKKNLREANSYQIQHEIKKIEKRIINYIRKKINKIIILFIHVQIVPQKLLIKNQNQI